MSYPYPGNGEDGPGREEKTVVLKRGLVALVFMFLFSLAHTVLFVVAVLQFFWLLIKGERNIFLASFGFSLSAWMAEAARFLAADSEEKPFPWKPWPET